MNATLQLSLLLSIRVLSRFCSLAVVSFGFSVNHVAMLMVPVLMNCTAGVQFDSRFGYSYSFGLHF